jgi:threonine/homoserine/homoserine lactone efflux protein
VEQKRSKLFTGALWVTLLNPKSILFFGAFLPQFIAKEYDFFYVFLLLGLIFIAIAFLIAFACAYVCGSVKDSNKNIGYVNNLHRVAGLVLLLLGSVSLLSVYQYL